MQNTHLTTINPATGKTIKSYPLMSEQTVEKKTQKSHQAFLEWSKKSLEERGTYFLKMADLLRQNKDKLALFITKEMGKPLKSAAAEIEKCVLTCEHYAKHSKDYLEPYFVQTEMSKSYVTYQALGVIFAIMPWNFPFWQVFRFAVPTLMAGNSALLKHAPITTGCGLAIEALFKEAGFPKQLFQTLVIDNTLAKKLIHHPKVMAVTLTGSNQTGKIIAEIAGQALKKVVLELGGNDPYLILEDADLDIAAQAVVDSRINNAGQSCIAAKRLLCLKPIKKAFQQLVLDKLKAIKVGDPTNPEVLMGPMAREDLRANLHRQVQESIKKGAKLVQGGFIPDDPGFYYPITVLENVKKGMAAFDEELFGPVFSFIDVKNEEEAIRFANDSPYGLSSAVFTRDLARGEKIASQLLNTGISFVNDFVKSDPRLPFGGIKGSGFGRELAGAGMHEFVNVKTIVVK